jgi:dipeptidyl aminopeptidase/acylaminoacyl peptidase
MNNAAKLSLILMSGLFLYGCQNTSNTETHPKSVMTLSETLQQNNPIQTEKKSVIDRQLFFADAEISYGQISPDGQYFSFLKPINDIKNIWIKPVEASFDEAYPVTYDQTRSINDYFWSQDSQQVLYKQDNGGNENYRIYATNPKIEATETNSTARDLTPIEKIRAYIYSTPKNTPNEIIIGINDRDPELHDVYKLNLETGKKNLIYENNEGITNFYFDLTGETRLAKRETESGGYEILRLDTEEITAVFSVEPEEQVFVGQFHPNGKQVYIYTNKESNLLDLRLLSIENGEVKLIDKDPENEVDIHRAIFSDINDELIATEYVGNKRRTYVKSQKMQPHWDALKAQFPTSEIYLRGSTRNESHWIVLVNSDRDPGSVYLYDSVTKTAELVYVSRPELPSEDLSPMFPITYEARDKLKIPAYLTIPKGVEAKNLPLVAYIHGGPHSRDMWGYDGYTQFFANRGYAVLQPNFRGSNGYGKYFLNAGNRQFGTGYMQHDITDGVQYLIDQGIVDPEKVAIFGGSYGGYATLAGLTFTPDLYKAGISYVGPSNLETLIKSVPPYWKPALSGWHRRIGNPEIPEDLEDMKSRSPLFFADKITAALMVIQGANDPRVKKQESDQIVSKMHELGRPVTYVLAENEGHGFVQEDNRLATTAAIEKFLAEQLGGRFQETMSEAVKEQLETLTVDPATVEVDLVGIDEEAE